MSLNLRNKKVTVIGAARSGIAVANTVVRLGGTAKISEFKSRVEAERELGGLESQEKVLIECGGHTQDFIVDSDLIVLSPGVRQDMKPVLWAKAAGIEVIGEIEFAYRLCPCPIIAVTGSNGKTTTVTVITEILKKAGRKVVLCGNIGSPFSRHVLTLKSSDIVVLEVSSFQLETTSTFKPHVAVWINFTANHMDRHKDLEEYYSAKKRICVNQSKDDLTVLNAAQAEFKDLASTLKSEVVFFNGTDKPVGIENPNFMAAMAAAKAVGISEDICRQVFIEFKGVEHRQELVRNLDGVDYINDSKSTTPEAGRWALTHLKKSMIMICGGSDKHLEFTSLKTLVKAKVKHMIVIGETKEILRMTFAGIVPVDVCLSLEEAVMKARQLSRPGDSIVLSPMCASFDMFNNFEHRGQVYKEIVMGLK